MVSHVPTVERKIAFISKTQTDKSMPSERKPRRVFLKASNAVSSDCLIILFV